jgi:hypothetical protein
MVSRLYGSNTPELATFHQDRGHGQWVEPAKPPQRAARPAVWNRERGDGGGIRGRTIPHGKSGPFELGITYTLPLTAKTAVLMSRQPDPSIWVESAEALPIRREYSPPQISDPSVLASGTALWRDPGSCGQVANLRGGGNERQ